MKAHHSITSLVSRLSRTYRFKYERVRLEIGSILSNTPWLNSSNHLILHNERMIHYIEKSFPKLIAEKLTEVEIFLLLCAVWLHDIGRVVTDFPLNQIYRNVHDEHSRDFVLSNYRRLSLVSSEAEIVALICCSQDRFQDFIDAPMSQKLKDLIVRTRLLVALLVFAHEIEFASHAFFPRIIGEEEVFPRDNVLAQGVDIDTEKKEILLHVLMHDKKNLEKIKTTTSLLRTVLKSVETVFSEYKLMQYVKHFIFRVKPVVVGSSTHMPRKRIQQFSLFLHSIATPSTGGIVGATSRDPDMLDLSNLVRKEEENLKNDLNRRGRTLNYTPNQFLVYKRWNSTSPVYSMRESNGGGYFLIWQHKGIVIDPGFGYLKNFLKFFSMEDIDAVIVTHDHPDHCDDIPKILTCLHECNKNKETKGEKAHTIDFLVSYGTYFRFSTTFGHYKSYLNVEKVLPNRRFDFNKHYLIVETTFTAHNEMLGDNTGFGLRLTLKRGTGFFDIGITGDTSYFADLSDIFDRVKMLVAHIGTIEDMRKTDFHKKHLGFRGVLATLLGFSKMPDLVLVSEFGEEMRGKRVQTCSKLQQYLRAKRKRGYCFPADLNMLIKLPQCFVKSTNSPTFLAPKQVLCVESLTRPEIFYRRK